MFNPERLTLARQRRGLKKLTLARHVGITPRTITDYELGRTEPVANILEKLASALDFPASFFFQPLQHTMPRDSASFRSLSRMTAMQAAAALAVGTMGIALNDWIEERFDLPQSDLPDLQPGIIDPEGAAALVRARWGLGESPISNMLHLLEAHGVRVFSLADECREVDAFSSWVNNTPYVCLATYKTAERAIFDGAHELGHLVLHRDHAAPRGRKEESEADTFASCFLMPAADVDASHPRNPTLDDIIRYKHRWRVSAAALSYRVHKLGITSDWHYREMCIELAHLGRNYEPEPIERERSQILSKVFTTMRQEGVGKKDIGEALSIYPEDLDALTFNLSMTAIKGGNERSSSPSPQLRLVR